MRTKTRAFTLVEVPGGFLPGEKALRCDDDAREYWRTEGASYAYQTLLSGRRVENTFLTRPCGPAIAVRDVTC